MGKLTRDGAYMTYWVRLDFSVTHLGQFHELVYREFTFTIPRDANPSVLVRQLCVHLGATSWDYIEGT